MVELVKRSVNLPKNAVPVISFILGIAIGAVAYPFTELSLVLRLWSGGFAGLASTGLFELVINNRAGKTKDE